MLQLSSSLEENLAALNARFGASADFYAKRIELYHCPGAIVLFDNMASLESLWSLLLDAATRHTPSLEPERMPHSGTQVYELLMHHSGLPAEDGPVKDMDDLIRRMTAGMAVLLLDGCKKGLVFSVQGLKSRSVEEPSGEGNLRGSREGFADLLRVNLSLLRRLIRTDTLVMETAQADCSMKTEYAICYCKDKAGKTAVARVRRTLQEAKPEGLLDSSYFVPWLFPARWRLFAPVSYTERPASAAAKLCEGKIIIFVNGSPSALVLPSLFCENFDCLDDYATTAVFSSFLRVLKYGSFYLSIFLPGVFVCLAVYLPELIPPQLLFKIAAAEKATSAPVQGKGRETAAAEVDEMLSPAEEPGAEEDAAESEKQDGAADKSSTDPEAHRKAFGKLMRGEYNREFGEMIVQATQKAYDSILNEQGPVGRILNALGQKYGTAPGDYEALAAAVEGGVVKDDAYYEDMAMKKGISVQLAKEMDALESENAKHRAAEQQRAEAAKMEAIQQEWDAAAERIRAEDPGFDIKMALADPDFAQMLKLGVKMEDAYKARYFDDIMARRTTQTAKTVEKGVEARIRQRGARPSENGTNPGGAAVLKTDVSKLTPQQCEELERRAMRGQIITF